MPGPLPRRDKARPPEGFDEIREPGSPGFDEIRPPDVASGIDWSQAQPPNTPQWDEDEVQYPDENQPNLSFLEQMGEWAYPGLQAAQRGVAKGLGGLWSGVEAPIAAAERLVGGDIPGLDAVRRYAKGREAYWQTQTPEMPQAETSAGRLGYGLAEAAAEAPYGFLKIAPWLATGAPALGMGAAAATEAYGGGASIPRTVLEAVKGLAMGKAMGLAGNIANPALRMAANAGIFGVPTALEGGTPEDIAAQALVGAAWGIPGRGRAPVEETRPVEVPAKFDEVVPPEVQPEVAPTEPLPPADFSKIPISTATYENLRGLGKSDAQIQAMGWTLPEATPAETLPAEPERRINPDLRRRVEDIPETERPEVIRQLQEQAYRDRLTGLGNDAALLTDLSEKPRSHYMQVDVDGLHTINKMAGDEAGNRLLVAVADAHRQAVQELKPGEIDLYRPYGDTFAGAADGPEPLYAIRDRARQILDENPLNFTVKVGGREVTVPFPVRFSAGISERMPPGPEAYQELRGANDALRFDKDARTAAGVRTERGRIPPDVARALAAVGREGGAGQLTAPTMGQPAPGEGQAPAEVGAAEAIAGAQASPAVQAMLGTQQRLNKPVRRSLAEGFATSAMGPGKREAARLQPEFDKWAEEQAAAPAIKQPWEMSQQDFVWGGAYGGPDFYSGIAKNEGPEAARLVYGLHGAGLSTIETHATKDGLVVRVAAPEDVLRSAGLPDSIPVRKSGLASPGDSADVEVVIPKSQVNTVVSKLRPVTVPTRDAAGDVTGFDFGSQEQAEAAHRAWVVGAQRRGENIPAEVLAEYGLKPSTPVDQAMQRITAGAGPAQAAEPVGSLLRVPGPGTETVGVGREAPTDIVQLARSIAKPTVSTFRPTAAPPTSAASSGPMAKAEASASVIKSVWDGLWDSYTKAPVATSSERAAQKWQGALQRVSWETDQFARQVVKANPNPVRRQAMAVYAEANGDPQKLRVWADNSSPVNRQKYETALSLTPDEQNFAKNARGYWDAKLDQAIQAGLLEQGVQDYVMHLVNRPNRALYRVRAEIDLGKLTTNPSFTKQRIHDTIYDIEQAGHEVNPDLGALVAAYETSFGKALANRAYIKNLTEAKAADGRPIAVPSPHSGVAVPETEGRSQAVLARQSIPPESLGDYKVVDHPALRGWVWSGMDTAGNPVFYKGDLLIHPEAYPKLKNRLATSWFRTAAVKIGDVEVKPFVGLMKIGQTVKGTMLDLSGFHQVQVSLHGLEHRINPTRLTQIDLNNPTQMGLVEGGLQIADYRAMEQFSEGSTSGSLVRKIPVLGTVAQKYNEYLFRSFIPRLKMTMALHALERNQGRYPKMAPEDLNALTAREANAAFGELNYRLMGRNPTFQDLLRLTLLAPDFLEARSRFVGQALKPYGAEQSTALMLGAVGLYGLARVANTLLNDDRNPHWERPFSLVYHGKEYRLRTVQGDLMHLLQDPRQFAWVRLNPAVTKPGLEMLSGRDEFGRPLKVGERLVDLAKQSVPIAFQKTLRNPNDYTALDSILQTLGVSNTRYRTSAEATALEYLQGNATVGERTPEQKAKERRAGAFLLRCGKGHESNDPARPFHTEGALRNGARGETPALGTGDAKPNGRASGRCLR